MRRCERLTERHISRPREQLTVSVGCLGVLSINSSCNMRGPAQRVVLLLLLLLAAVCALVQGAVPQGDNNGVAANDDNSGVALVVTALAIGKSERDNGYASGVLALGASLDANADVPDLVRVCVVDKAAHQKYGAILEKAGWHLVVSGHIACKQNAPSADKSQETLSRFKATCSKLHIFKLLNKVNAQALIGDARRVRAMLYLDSDSICVGSLRALFDEWGNRSSQYTGLGMALDENQSGDYQSNCIIFGRRFLESSAAESTHSGLLELAATTVSADGSDQGLINAFLRQHKEDVRVSLVRLLVLALVGLCVYVCIHMYVWMYRWMD
jgi:hypothetical protein